MARDDSCGEAAGDELDPTLPVRELSNPASESHDVTRILSRIDQGDGQAAEQLLPLVYEELRKLAAAKMAQERPDQTLQATALVHEAYIRLVDARHRPQVGQSGPLLCGRGGSHAPDSRRTSARKGRLAAGGEYQRVELTEVDLEAPAPQLEVLALNDALDALDHVDPRKAQLVKLRFFAGLTHQEAADALGVSASTAYVDWNYAKSWLRVAILGEPPRDA